MEKIILTMIIFCTTLTLSLSAQDILWKKNYGLTTADDYGRAVVGTNDGGIAIVGYTGSYGAGGFDVWLIKTDANGNSLWSKTYGGVGDDYGYSLKQTDDGGFVIGGATNSFGAGGLDSYLIRTDSLGDTLWTKTFGGANDDRCWSLEVVDDGYVLAGEKNYHPDVWIIKTDPNGNLLWEKTFGSSGDDVAYSINKLDNNSFIISGQIKITDTNGWLIKIDSQGDTLWTKFFGGTTFNDKFLFSRETEDNGYIITGVFYSGANSFDLWLLKTDSLGNVEWEKTYDYANEPDYGYSVQQTSDGGYIIAGGASPPDIEQRGWIIRTDSIGEIIWTKFINSYTESLYGSSTVCYSVVQAANGDYIIAGHQTQVTFQQEVMLLRIASDIVPVELTSFIATAQQNSVSLNWQTATETNNSGFEMQRSQMSNVNSQMDWQVIGFVPGFGTTTEPKSYSFTDENLSAGKYQYRLKQIDFDGTFEYSNTVEVEINSPTEFSLEQNYPNPFNPTTKIKYTIPSTPLSFGEGLGVRLLVYDILGNEVATLVNEQQQPGTYEVEFNVGQTISLSSGVYYYQLKAGGYTQTKKMLLMK